MTSDELTIQRKTLPTRLANDAIDAYLFQVIRALPVFGPEEEIPLERLIEILGLSSFEVTNCLKRFENPLFIQAAKFESWAQRADREFKGTLHGGQRAARCEGQAHAWRAAANELRRSVFSPENPCSPKEIIRNISRNTC